MNPSRGTCTATTIVTCSLHDIAAGADAVVAIRIRPSTTGDIVAAARVTADSMIDDASDNAATAVVSVETPRRELVLRYPNGGETIRSGRGSAVQFTLRGVEGGVNVELSIDDGRTWTSLAPNAPNVGFYDWVPSAGVQSLARVRVTSLADPRLTATSAASFAIR
jgi:uncharacterized protein YbjQ (UPF0145 family)